MSESSPAILQNPSLVHTIETNVGLDLPDEYSDFRRRPHLLEFTATTKVYRYFDSIEGKHRESQLLGCRAFAWFVKHKESGSIKVMSNACRLRWCPICSQAKSYFLKTQVRSFVDSCENPKFLTLTYKHSEAPLHHQIRSLYQHFRKFRMLKYLKKNIAGGVWFFQVKRSKKTGQWHPHIHCVLDAGYMAQSHLSDLWLKVTKTSSVIDIRAIKDKEKTADYVSRYASRPAPLSDYNETDQRDIFSAMHGLRLCGKWGTARYLKLSMQAVPDGADWDKICSYNEAVQQYETNPACKIVIDCWRNQQPAPDNLFVASQYENNPRYIPENLRNLEIADLLKEPP